MTILNDIITTFKTVKPAWKPPHETVFAVARHRGQKATINGKPETWWLPRLDKLFEDLDERLETLRVKIAKESFTLCWEDCRKVRIK